MSARQVASLVWVDATAGVPLVFGVINLAVTVSLTALVGGNSMSGGIGDPLNLLLTISMYTAAIGLGGSAAHGSSIARKGLIELASVAGRGRWAPVRVGMLACIAWTVVSQLIGLAIVSLRSGPGHSSPWVILLGVLAFVLTAALSAVGSVLGSRFTAAPVAAVLAIVTLAWFYGFSYAPGNLRKLSPVYPEVFYSQPVIEPNHQLILGQIGLSLALVIFSGGVVAGQGALRIIPAALAASVGAAGAALVISAAPAPTQYPTGIVPTCRTQSATTMCVFPLYKDDLSANLTVVNRVRSAVGPYLDTPSTYVQVGLPSQPGSVSYAGLYSADLDQRFADAADAVLPSQLCAESQAASGAAVELRQWALARAGHPDLYAEQPDYMAWTPQQTRTWVADRLGVLRRPC